MNTVLLYVVGFPIACAIGAYLGRKAMREMWGLDLPYGQRPRWPSMRGGAGVPHIPKDRWF